MRHDIELAASGRGTPEAANRALGNPGSSGERGMTLIEVMIATLVLLIGVLGLMAANVVAAQQNGGAAKQNRASALGLDILSTMSRWDYRDARLINNTANDATIFDSGRFLTAPNSSDYEIDIDNATNNNGSASPAQVIDSSKLDYNGNGTSDFRRFAALSPLMDSSTGQQIGLRVKAVVYWNEGVTWRRVVLHSAVYDPSGNQAAVPGL